MTAGKYGFLYEPETEGETMILFGALLPYLGKELGASEYFLDEWTERPTDCTLVADGKKLAVEFETYSSHFKEQGHDPNKCDILVCWKNDWASCPKKIRIIELCDVVSRLKQEGLPEIIRNERPKHPDRAGRRYSVEEFMAKLKESLEESDFQKLKSFIDETTDKPGIELMTGKGRKIATLAFGSRLTKGSYPLSLESSGKAGIVYYNVNVKPYARNMDEKTENEIRRALGEPRKKWHYIRASNTDELIEKLRRIVDILAEA